MLRLLLGGVALVSLCAAIGYGQVQDSGDASPGARGQPQKSSKESARKGAAPAKKAAPTPARAALWEYAVHTREEIAKMADHDLAAGLNKLGAQRWELVSVDPGVAGPRFSRA